MKKIITILTLVSLTLFGCSQKSEELSVVTREEGSGTRGAFVDIFNIKEEGIDAIQPEAEITNSTAVMLKTIENNKNGIGYVSMGSMNDQIKGLKIEGNEATRVNIINGSYPVSRSFYLVYKENLSAMAQDFLKFVGSQSVNQIITDEGYIALENQTIYEPSKMEGDLTISGSSSVTPVIKALITAYQEINPKVNIELQETDSTAGVNATLEDVSEIGMTSRSIKPEEEAAGLEALEIAKDGIVVIVHKDSKINDLSMEEVREIFLGNIRTFSEIQ